MIEEKSKKSYYKEMKRLTTRRLCVFNELSPFHHNKFKCCAYFLFYFFPVVFFFVGDFYDETKSEDGQKSQEETRSRRAVARMKNCYFVSIKFNDFIKFCAFIFHQTDLLVCRTLDCLYIIFSNIFEGTGGTKKWNYTVSEFSAPRNKHQVIRPTPPAPAPVSRSPRTKTFVTNCEIKKVFH